MRVRILSGVVLRGGNVNPGDVLDLEEIEWLRLKGQGFAERVAEDTPLKGTIAPLVPPPPPAEPVRVVVLRATVIQGRDVLPGAQLEVPAELVASLEAYGSVRRVDAAA